MDLLASTSTGTFGGLESACRRRTSGPITKRGGFAAFESQDGKSLSTRNGKAGVGLVERCRERRRRSTCAGVPKASFWGLLGSGGGGIYIREHRDWPAARSQFLSFARKRVCMLPRWTEDRFLF